MVEIDRGERRHGSGVNYQTNQEKMDKLNMSLDDLVKSNRSSGPKNGGKKTMDKKKAKVVKAGGARCV